MSRHLVVLGDVLLDRDVTGRVARTSPDGTAPVLDIDVTNERPGGAGLTALLAARAGADVTLIAPIGTDRGSQRAAELLERHVKLISVPTPGKLPTKTRIRTDNEVIVRVDEGGPCPPHTDLPDAVQPAVDDANAILVSDYGQGFTTNPQVRFLVELSTRNVPVVWDPHPRGAAPVANVSLVTPNETEALRLADRSDGLCESGSQILQIRAIADWLVEKWRARAVAVTLGQHGALLSFGRGAPLVVPTQRTITGESCGAGDSFAAEVSVALGGGAPLARAVCDGVQAATEFVERGAASGISRVISPSNSTRSAWLLVDHARRAGECIVATGGCFDMLHAGHVAMLRHARQLGDRLIVLLNTDDSAQRLKGPNRPVVDLRHRRQILEALEDVDAVIPFDDCTPAHVLEELRPDIWVKGGDYAGRELPEAEVVRAYGGEVLVVPYVDNQSTSALRRDVTDKTRSSS